MRWDGQVARMERTEVRIGEANGKEVTWQRRHIWKFNIKMDIQEIRCGLVMD